MHTLRIMFPMKHTGTSLTLSLTYHLVIPAPSQALHVCACDEFTIKAKALMAEGNQDELKRLTILNNLHKKKAQTFYDRKKNARIKSKTDIEFQAIAMDYQKNVSLPNITTNDVYYKRQLSMYSFNIHVLSDASSFFFSLTLRIVDARVQMKWFHFYFTF